MDFVSVLDAIAQQMVRLGFNVRRARRLIDLAGDKGESDSATASDVLRAAVVLLHATLEDYLRTLSVAHLRFSPGSALNGVPLAGLGGDRPEKFLLGALTDFRHLTVLELIDLSISEHLERTTYNNTRELASVLGVLRLDLNEFRPFFKDLDDMMLRRHGIVHRADVVQHEQPRLEPELAPINASDVSRWADRVNEFAMLATRRASLARMYERFPFLAREYARKASRRDADLLPGAGDGA